MKSCLRRDLRVRKTNKQKISSKGMSLQKNFVECQISFLLLPYPEGETTVDLLMTNRLQILYYEHSHDWGTKKSKGSVPVVQFNTRRFL